MSSTDRADTVDRVFGAFLIYKASPNAQRLMTVLRTLNGMVDELSRPSGPRFLDFPEYVALNTLRAYVTGRSDLDQVLRVCALPPALLASDTSHVCLVAMSDCRAAVNALPPGLRPVAARAFTSSCKVWGPLTDIHPALFNCMVKAFEALQFQGLRGGGAAYMAFADAFRHEEDNDLPHFVSGPCVEWDQEPEQFEDLMIGLYEG